MYFVPWDDASIKPVFVDKLRQAKSSFLQHTFDNFVKIFLFNTTILKSKFIRSKIKINFAEIR